MPNNKAKTKKGSKQTFNKTGSTNSSHYPISSALLQPTARASKEQTNRHYPNHSDVPKSVDGKNLGTSWLSPSFGYQFALNNWNLSGQIIDLTRETGHIYTNATQTLLNQKQHEFEMTFYLLAQVSRLIDQHKRYELLFDYYKFYLDFKTSQTEPIDDELEIMFFYGMANLYKRICLLNHKLLVGLDFHSSEWEAKSEAKSKSNKFKSGADHRVTWQPLPPLLEDTQDITTADRNWEYAYQCLIKTMIFISCEPRQQAFDQLLLPSQQHWPNIANTQPAQTTAKLEKTIAQSLGKAEGCFTQADLEHLMERIALEGSWLIVPDRPVLIRVQNHSVVERIILMSKVGYILAKLELCEPYGEFLEVIRLDRPLWFGFWHTAKSFVSISEVGDKPASTPKPVPVKSEYNWAIPGLIASVYLDLVKTEHITKDKKYAIEAEGISSPNLDKVESTPGLDQNNKTNSPQNQKWYWQYLPRRQYHYNKPTLPDGFDNNKKSGLAGDAEIVIERQPLSDQQKNLQNKLRRFHMVGLHRMMLPPNRKPSPIKLEQAHEMGLELLPNQTWRVAHGRGFEDLKKAIEEIGIDNIPHFMLKRTGLLSSLTQELASHSIPQTKSAVQ